ncbi:MAG: hypothetical protein OXO52_17290 [Rhodospirillales bacterium]|nr:hypothetical protein [Rhodospirillales bacterium]MDE0378508.1 hypothetical protein [Rhodospirillales bacterium]
MREKRPGAPVMAAENVGGSAVKASERGRQGELWDEAGREVLAAQESSGTGGRSAARTVEDSADQRETQSGGGLERNAEAGGDTPEPDEVLRVASHLLALIEEGGRSARDPPTAAPEDQSRPAERPGHEDECEARPEEQAGRATGEAGEADAEAKSAASEQERAGAAAEAIQALRTFRADFGRWIEGERRSRRRWAGLAMAAGFPAALVLGALVEQQFQLVSLHDPTDGWGSRVWERYGWTVVECILEAMRTQAEVSCPVVVRWP